MVTVRYYQICNSPLDIPSGDMLKKLISNAMLSIVMDKQAKEKLHALREIRKGTKIANGDIPPGEPAQPPEKPDAPNRQELIAQAMAIHQSKLKILDDLTLNEKQKLQDLAAKALLGQNIKDEKG